MGFSLNLALRYMRSRKRAFISVSTVFAILGVALGTAALATVMSVTGGFRAEFRDKVLGVNAHVLVLKYSSEFRDYREIMAKVRELPEVIGAGPFVINPMMITHAGRTATGVLVKGVDPTLMGEVLDLPRHMIEGSLEGLVVAGRAPANVDTDVDADDDADVDVDRTDLGQLDPGQREPGQPAPDTQRPATRGAGFLELLRSLPLAADAGAPVPEAASDEPEPEPDLALGASDLPAGSIVPEGGYGSELPDEDIVPDSVDPDPCLSDTSSLPGIVIGSALRQTLNVQVGECVQVTSPTIGYSFVRGALRPPVAKQFRVIGVFQAGFDQYDSKLVYTELHEAQAFYQAGDTVTGVEMKIADIDRAAEVAEKIEALLGSKLYHILDWQELNHGLFTALRIQQILMSLVLALIILVAAFTVIATLIMVVLDKKREIAVIKAMGASDWHLLRAFLYQGLIIGVVGMVLGLGTGYAVCRWILAYGFPLDPKVYFISRLPVQIRPTEFLLTGAFAVVACLAATVWPALHAARLRPAEAFRDT
ncbi:MAG TPA: ABC transporter permease [Polyangiaceae bacterium]|nr:ABC transporter permease [Polyangiaceae bacterium]